jgi:hypothetical protein
MVLLKDYLVKLRKELREDNKSFEEEFFGNGSTNSWVCKQSPVTSGSVTVLFDGVLVSPENYALDYATGKIVFDPSPEDGVVVNLNYKYVDYDDETLVYYLDKAINTVESLYELGYETSGYGLETEVNGAPTKEIESLWFRMCLYLIKEDDLITVMEGAQNWRDGGVSVNEVQNINMRRQVLDNIKSGILWDLERLAIENTKGNIRAGGKIPHRREEDVDDKDIILWYNGKVGW